MNSDDTPFWRRKSLAEMTDSEWESLCDGCGRCCLVKLEDADDASRTFFTDVGCRLLDGETCPYRLLADGRDLFWCLPIVSADPETVHQAGISVRGKVGACEDDVPDEDL